MAIQSAIASSLVSFLLKEFGGELKNVCMEGKFSIKHGDVDVHLELCEEKAKKVI